MGTFEPSETEGATEGASETDSSFPADFSPDEAEFASEMRRLFVAEREELPPLYVQTLAGDLRHRPVEASFEQKVTYHVFRRLGLPRSPLFERPEGVPARLSQWRRQAVGVAQRLGRTGAAVAAFALTVMALSAILATPSFAAGLRILFGQTGVQQVPSYPTSVRAARAASHGGAAADVQAPPRSIDWLGPNIDGYVYHGIYLNSPQEWSQGPVLELRYTLPDQVQTAGTGVLDIREFQLAPSLASVLQVVADGSVTQVTIGDQPGVFVNGSWESHGRIQIWQSGEKGELILERDGLIFWIVADQRDGMSQAKLVAAAEQLTSVPLNQLLPTRPSLRMLGDQLEISLDNPGAGEVLNLIPAGVSPESGPGAFVSIANWDLTGGAP